MNISLTPNLEKLVNQKVASGRYTSASEVMREALRLLEEHDRLREMRMEELRAEIRKGIESGPSTPLDFEDIKIRGRKKLEEIKQKAKKKD
jgi:antitoxin ParD1/3/4